jgi:nucleotide-binding universal stress UspA family protein
MYKHLLTPIDGSERSLEAARHAIAFAKLCNARLTAVTACPSFQQLKDKGYFPPTLEVDRGEWEQGIADRARAILARFEAEAQDAGVVCGTVLVMDDHPYRTIVDTANANGCDLIVMGSHGYGRVKQWVLGSQTTRVLSHTKIPVLVYR